jgi:hypothetical protein
MRVVLLGILDPDPPAPKAKDGQDARRTTTLCSASTRSPGHLEISTPRSFLGFVRPPGHGPANTRRGPGAGDTHLASLGVLFNLARTGLPHHESYEAEHRLLAESVAQSRSHDVDQLLIDLKESARGTPFPRTGSGQALPHHETAFIGGERLHGAECEGRLAVQACG